MTAVNNKLPRSGRSTTIDPMSVLPPDAQALKAAFGRHLAELARTRGFATAAALARALGRSKMAVGHWMNGRSLPGGDTLIELSSVLGCSIADLFALPEFGVDPRLVKFCDALRDAPPAHRETALAAVSSLTSLLG